MTAAALAAAEPPAAARRTSGQWAVMAAAVLLALAYSQAWTAPITRGAEPDAATSALLRSLFYPVYLIALALAATGPVETLRTALKSPLLLALLAVIAASTLWSVAPDMTARRVVALGFTTLTGVVLAARLDWRRLVEAISAAHALLVIGCFLVGVFVPEIGRHDPNFPFAWRGLWTEKNGLGSAMAIAAVLFVAAAALSPRRRLLWLVFAGLATTLVLLSTSKTSLLALTLAGCAMLFVFLVRRGAAMGVATTWLAAVAAGLAALGLFFAADAFLEFLGKDPTLTGRTQLWQAIWRRIEARPLTGYGYGAVWDNTATWSPGQWIGRDADGFFADHAHNSWLEAWLNFGLVGLLVFAAWFAMVWLRTAASVYRDLKGEGAAYVAFPFLCLFTLLTLTESVAFTYNDLRWVLLVAFATKLAAGARSWRR